MKAALILFLAAAVIPIFFSRLRMAPLWLTVQAVALGWAGAAQHDGTSPHALAALAEVLVLRALVAPQLLRRALRARAEPNQDLMPSNLFAWAVAIALIVLAFEFGAPAVSGPVADHHALILGAVAATVAVALLLLAANNAPPAQLVAVLFMENALALFELMLPQPWPLPVHLALGLIYLLTVGVGAWLIGRPDEGAVASAADEGGVAGAAGEGTQA